MSPSSEQWANAQAEPERRTPGALSHQPAPGGSVGTRRATAALGASLAAPLPESVQDEIWTLLLSHLAYLLGASEPAPSVKIITATWFLPGGPGDHRLERSLSVFRGTYGPPSCLAPTPWGTSVLLKKKPEENPATASRHQISLLSSVTLNHRQNISYHRLEMQAARLIS